MKSLTVVKSTRYQSTVFVLIRDTPAVIRVLLMPYYSSSNFTCNICNCLIHNWNVEQYCNFSNNVHTVEYWLFPMKEIICNIAIYSNSCGRHLPEGIIFYIYFPVCQDLDGARTNWRPYTWFDNAFKASNVCFSSCMYVLFASASNFFLNARFNATSLSYTVVLYY